MSLLEFNILKVCLGVFLCVHACGGHPRMFFFFFFFFSKDRFTVMVLMRSLVDGAVWGGLGGVTLLEEIHH